MAFACERFVRAQPREFCKSMEPARIELATHIGHLLPREREALYRLRRKDRDMHRIWLKSFHSSVRPVHLCPDGRPDTGGDEID